MNAEWLVSAPQISTRSLTTHHSSIINHPSPLATVYRILFHIPLEIKHVPVLGDVPVFGLGLLLAVWVLFSVGLLLWLIRRQGLNADTLGYLPLLLLVGAIIWGVLPAVCDQEGFPIRGYGVMMLVAVVSGTGLLLWRGRRVGLHPDLILSLAFWMFLPGIVAARLFYVIQYWPAYQQHQSPGAILAAAINLTDGGLVAFGAFIGGMLGLVLFVRKYRQPFLALCDLIAPCIILGLALGRIGCLLNGCCFGGTCELDWAVTFPKGDLLYSPPYESQVRRGRMHGFDLGADRKAAPRLRLVDPEWPAWQAGLRAGDRVQRIGGRGVQTTQQASERLMELFEGQQPVAIQVEGRKPVILPAIVPHPPRSLRVHPTQVYSSINAFLLCLLLLAYDPLRRRDGELLALMLSIYPIARFLLEEIRNDEPDFWFTHMTISQNISLMLLLCGMGLWFYILRQPRGKAFG
jgi:phosphatidylglycerol:prolipoprotein diacylglycerol transferase